MENFIYILSTGNWPASGAMLGQFFRIIFITAAIALLAYYATKLLATRGRARFSRGANLQHIETIAVTAHVMIQLVRAGEKYLVLGVTKERVNVLAVLTKEEINEPDEPEMGAVNVPFNKILSRFLPQAKDGQRDEDLNE